MPPTFRPVLLEVLAYGPTDFFHCSHCERLFDAAGIGAPVHREILVSFFKSLRHRARRYPTFVVNGRRRVSGWDQDALERLLRDELSRGGEV